MNCIISILIFLSNDAHLLNLVCYLAFSPNHYFPDLNKDGKLEWKDFDMAREVIIITVFM